MATQTRRTRTATPERWQKALGRAIDGNVRVAQLESTGQWIATSATDPSSAYELEVVRGSAVGCTCTAGQYGDPVCCHRAAYWAMVGLLELEEEGATAPEPAAAAVTVVTLSECVTCHGSGEIRIYTGGGLNDYWAGQCRQCEGSGQVTRQLVAA